MVVGIVFVMIFLLNAVLGQEARSAVYVQRIAPVTESIELKDAILNCTGTLTDRKLDEIQNTNTCLIGSVQGYSVENLGFLECATQAWVIGNTLDCDHKFSFLTNVIDEQNDTCLARITICLKGESE